ncbi:hypothetical protein ACHAWF_009178 [Thalassiosira exigua]
MRMARGPFPWVIAVGATVLTALAPASASCAFVPSARRQGPLRHRQQPRPATPPGKGDLYDDETLFELLTLHRALNPEGLEQEEDGDLNEVSIAAGGIHGLVLDTLSGDESGPSDAPAAPEASAIPGLHELVLETIEDISSPTAEEGKPANQLAYDNLQALLVQKKPGIRAITTDVDGTLLAGQYLHPATEEAVLKAIHQSYHDDSGTGKIRHFFPATGKSRKGAVGSLGPAIGPLLYGCPGVYIQGLYCVDGDGNVVFEQKLTSSAVAAAEELVADFGISVVGYDGDDLYTTEQTEVVVSLSEFYGEPTVQLILGEDGGSAIELARHGPGMHKLMLMDEDLDLLAKVRPKLEALAEKHDATVTQALPTMLELLPEGCSKAYGVGKVCEALGIDAAKELIALGDAENDADMLRNAAIGVAVGNACPQARDAADFIMRERHDEGGAGLAMNLFGFDS